MACRDRQRRARASRYRDIAHKDGVCQCDCCLPVSLLLVPHTTLSVGGTFCRFAVVLGRTRDCTEAAWNGAPLGRALHRARGILGLLSRQSISWLCRSTFRSPNRLENRLVMILGTRRGRHIKGGEGG